MSSKRAVSAPSSRFLLTRATPIRHQNSRHGAVAFGFIPGGIFLARPGGCAFDIRVRTVRWWQMLCFCLVLKCYKHPLYCRYIVIIMQLQCKQCILRLRLECFDTRFRYNMFTPVSMWALLRACLELGPLGQRRSFSCCQANTLTTIWTLDSTWQAPNQPEMMRRTAKLFADQRSICTICGPSLRQWSVTLPGMLLPAWLDLRPELPKPSNSFITAARDHLKFERFKTSNTTLSHTTVSHTHKSVTQLFHMQFGHTHNICPTQSVFHHILSLSCLSHSMFTSAIERS